MQACINVLVQIYTSAFFYGFINESFRNTWAKLICMKHIFPCGGGMHLLIAGFASNEYLHGEAGLRELSFEFEFVCS